MEKIRFTSDERQEETEFFVLEQTKLNGVSYILVTDSEEDDAECLILKDTSAEEEKESMDRAMQSYAACLEKFTGKKLSEIPGTGAAGGLGFAFLWGLPNVELKPGIDIVLEAVGLASELQDADIVVTGEGCLDFQTAMGKVPVGVAKAAKQYGCEVIAFAGSVTEEAIKCNEKGIDAFFSILPRVCSLDEAMDTEIAQKNMRNAAEQVFRLILTLLKEKCYE